MARALHLGGPSGCAEGAVAGQVGQIQCQQWSGFHRREPGADANAGRRAKAQLCCVEPYCDRLLLAVEFRAWRSIRVRRRSWSGRELDLTIAELRSAGRPGRPSLRGPWRGRRLLKVTLECLFGGYGASQPGI